jgi:hypothetical protein
MKNYARRRYSPKLSPFFYFITICKKNVSDYYIEKQAPGPDIGKLIGSERRYFYSKAFKI